MKKKAIAKYKYGGIHTKKKSKGKFTKSDKVFGGRNYPFGGNVSDFGNDIYFSLMNATKSPFPDRIQFALDVLRDQRNRVQSERGALEKDMESYLNLDKKGQKKSNKSFSDFTGPLSEKYQQWDWLTNTILDTQDRLNFEKMRTKKMQDGGFAFNNPATNPYPIVGGGSSTLEDLTGGVVGATPWGAIANMGAGAIGSIVSLIRQRKAKANKRENEFRDINVDTNPDFGSNPFGFSYGGKVKKYQEGGEILSGKPFGDPYDYRFTDNGIMTRRRGTKKWYNMDKWAKKNEKNENLYKTALGTLSKYMGEPVTPVEPEVSKPATLTIPDTPIISEEAMQTPVVDTSIIDIPKTVIDSTLIEPFVNDTVGDLDLTVEDVSGGTEFQRQGNNEVLGVSNIAFDPSVELVTQFPVESGPIDPVGINPSLSGITPRVSTPAGTRQITPANAQEIGESLNVPWRRAAEGDKQALKTLQTQYERWGQGQVGIAKFLEKQGLQAEATGLTKDAEMISTMMSAATGLPLIARGAVKFAAKRYAGKGKDFADDALNIMKEADDQIDKKYVARIERKLSEKVGEPVKVWMNNSGKVTWARTGGKATTEIPEGPIRKFINATKSEWKKSKSKLKKFADDWTDADKINERYRNKQILDKARKETLKGTGAHYPELVNKAPKVSGAEKYKDLFDFKYGGKAKMYQHGGVPIQTEKDEMMQLPTGEIEEVNATRKHEDMPDDMITDVVPETTKVFSERIKVKYGDLPPDLAAVYGKASKSKLVSMADIAEAVDKKYDKKTTDTPYGTEELNERNKNYLMSQLFNLNEMLSPEKSNFAYGGKVKKMNLGGFPDVYDRLPPFKLPSLSATVYDPTRTLTFPWQQNVVLGSTPDFITETRRQSNRQDSDFVQLPTTDPDFITRESRNYTEPKKRGGLYDTIPIDSPVNKNKRSFNPTKDQLLNAATFGADLLSTIIGQGQKTPPLMRIPTTYTDRMKTTIPDASERYLRSYGVTADSINSSIGNPALRSAATANANAETLRALTDYNYKRNEAQTGLYNQKQAALQQIAGSNSQLVNQYNANKTQLGNLKRQMWSNLLTKTMEDRRKDARVSNKNELLAYISKLNALAQGLDEKYLLPESNYPWANKYNV